MKRLNLKRVILHKDKTVTFWSLYSLQWIRQRQPSDRELATMDPKTRAKALEHIAE